VGDEAFGLSTIGQIRVPVTDVARAEAFYRDVLGMRFLFAYPGMSFFDCDGVRLFLAAPEPGAETTDRPCPVMLYFSVPSVAAAHEELLRRGAEEVESPRVVHRAATHDLWMAFVRDPDGNQIGVMAELPKAA
jgi:methylmalonyl-CoA/ethylmalonyl-CoA epimerase